jgi:hypothetical protein
MKKRIWVMNRITHRNNNACKSYDDLQVYETNYIIITCHFGLQHMDGQHPRREPLIAMT